MVMHIPVAYYVALMICLVTTSKVTNGAIGVTWGRQSYQRLVPSMVVDLILQNGVQYARIYSAPDDILKAFCGSNIDLTVGIYWLDLITNDDNADEWVNKRIVKYHKKVNIRRVFIGNYVFKNAPEINDHDNALRECGINTLALIQKALNKAGNGDVKASLPFSPKELKPNTTRPSDAEFNPDLRPGIKRVLEILKANNSPFVVQIFPALFASDNKMNPAFAFPDNKDSSLFVHDKNGAVYTNAFDFVYDSFVWSLEKAGFPNMSLVVDEAGWATDGLTGGNLSTAERFFRGLLPRAASNVGTPKRKGKPIDLYVHSLADEPMNFAKTEPWARHWGIYRSNGEPKYKIDLTGRGRDIYPVRAGGIMRMPNRWCVFNNDTSNPDKLEGLADLACSFADCTSLEAGGSCSRLNFNERMSYMFNVYFQTYFQEDGSCDFRGLGEVVTDDPSVGHCVFTVEVVKGSQNNIKLNSRTELANSADRIHGINNGDRCHVFLVLFIISIFFLAAL